MTYSSYQVEATTWIKSYVDLGTYPGKVFSALTEVWTGTGSSRTTITALIQGFSTKGVIYCNPSRRKSASFPLFESHELYIQSCEGLCTGLMPNSDDLYLEDGIWTTFCVGLFFADIFLLSRFCIQTPYDDRTIAER